MDKWPCPHCAEELLGAANRCWKCGNRVQPPTPKERAAAAVAAGEASVGDILMAADAAAPIALAEPPAPQWVMLTIEEAALALTKEPPRRGSPFAFEATLIDRQPHETFYGAGPYSQETKPRTPHVPPRKAVYPRHTSAIGGVVAALILGPMSLVILYFTVLGGVTAAIGVGCAVWGLYSPKRRPALIALIFCCLVLMLAAWKLGFVVYEYFHVPVAPTFGAPGEL